VDLWVATRKCGSASLTRLGSLRSQVRDELANRYRHLRIHNGWIAELVPALINVERRLGDRCRQITSPPFKPVIGIEKRHS
jgi:hypothetical protein